MEPDKLYPNIVSVRNTEAILGWTRTSFFSAFIGGTFIFVITRFPVGSFQHTALCAAGAVLSIFWLLASLRSRKLVSYWNKRLADLEDVDNDPTHPRVFAAREFEIMDTRRGRNHNVMLGLIGSIGIGWLCLVLRSLWSTDWKAVGEFFKNIGRIF